MTEKNMKYIEVVAAVIINHRNQIFCARRKDQGELALKWEFPGGKIEQHESYEEALVREIKEEFSTTIKVKDFIMTVKHQYRGFHLTMHAFYAEVIEGSLTLNEHTDSKWLSKNELYDLDWAEADLPIVHALFLESEVLLIHEGVLIDKWPAAKLINVETLKSIYGNTITYSNNLEYREVTIE